ncbi:MAG: CADD family putative folate metabolism protein [Chloroflexi bacterium]|nr:CADD family putative folate metabolism protein [Chloroflexota bacterium]MDA1220088.1 CADD family putative folate metabolism protein [Chloroflexota bacterium]
MTETLLNRLQQLIDDKSLLTHPFYQAWQAGELSIEDLQIYASQYYFFEANFPRFLSAIHSKCGDREVRQSILDNLWDEEHGVSNHRAMWLDFCASLGLDKDQVEFTEIQPKTQGLLDAYFHASSQGSCSEGLAAMYAYEAQVPQVALEKIRGLREFYGIDSPEALQFFEVHSVLDEDHAAKEAEGIVSQTSPETEAQVEKALQSALDAWWGFLDGIEEQRYSQSSAAD